MPFKDLKHFRRYGRAHKPDLIVAASFDSMQGIVIKNDITVDYIRRLPRRWWLEMTGKPPNTALRIQGIFVERFATREEYLPVFTSNGIFTPEDLTRASQAPFLRLTCYCKNRPTESILAAHETNENGEFGLVAHMTKRQHENKDYTQLLPQIMRAALVRIHDRVEAERAARKLRPHHRRELGAPLQPALHVREHNTMKFVPVETLAGDPPSGAVPVFRESGIKKREHDVIGFFRQPRRKPCVSPTGDHMWITDESGQFQTCAVCDHYRVRVKPHKRGDASLGRVTRVIQS